MQIPSEWSTLPGRHEAEHESHGMNFLESVKKNDVSHISFYSR